VKVKFKSFPVPPNAKAPTHVGLVACPTCYRYIPVTNAQWKEEGPIFCEHCSMAFSVRAGEIVDAGSKEKR